MIWSRRPVGAGDVEQSGKPGTAALPHDRKALDDKSAVEPDERHDVSDRCQRDEVEGAKQIRAFAAFPEASLPQRAVQSHERHERHARGAEIAQAREVVLAVGIDERRRLWEHLGA